jgi:uncharacterized membrane protein YqaE (UPF0057 family)
MNLTLSDAAFGSFSILIELLGVIQEKGVLTPDDVINILERALSKLEAEGRTASADSLRKALQKNLEY